MLVIPDRAGALSQLLRDLRESRENKKASRKKSILRRQRLTSEDRKAILSKTDGRCHICGGKVESRWHADHVLAHSAGGQHSVDNYLPADPLCNNYRWDYMPEEFQLILKLGVWARTQIEKETGVGMRIAEGFVKYERLVAKRRKRFR